MPAATAVEPGLEYVVTVTLIVADVPRSTASPGTGTLAWFQIGRSWLN
jgi:hypothetical protein